MQTMHIDRVDFNLTAPLVALLEERHELRAADRVGLSQPAMSRALQRLRRLFDDPILIRDGHGFVCSPRADDIYDQLKIIIPHLEQSWTSAEFNPNEPEPPVDTAGSDQAVQVDEATSLQCRTLLVAAAEVRSSGRGFRSRRRCVWSTIVIGDR
jgi:hypothetical protein